MLTKEEIQVDKSLLIKAPKDFVDFPPLEFVIPKNLSYFPNEA